MATLLLEVLERAAHEPPRQAENCCEEDVDGWHAGHEVKGEIEEAIFSGRCAFSLQGPAALTRICTLRVVVVVVVVVVVIVVEVVVDVAIVVEPRLPLGA